MTPTVSLVAERSPLLRVYRYGIATILKHTIRWPTTHRNSFSQDNVFQYGESVLLLLSTMLNQDLHLLRTDTLNTHFYN